MKYLFLALISIIILSSCGQEISEPTEIPPPQEESLRETETESSESLSLVKEPINEMEKVPEYLNIQKDGSDLVFERVLEQNSSYTRYQISYKSEWLKISGIMNIPKGAWNFPLVILNHGYIDPAIYTLGRGLKREQDYLARNGFTVLHTDYRNHAFSDTDESLQGTGSILRSKKYWADAINAVLAVQKAKKQWAKQLEYVESENIWMLGHSMWGGVTMFALVAAPELIDAAILYAPVHSQEWYNFERWRRNSLTNTELFELQNIHGDLWDKESFIDISPQTYFERVEAPVQMYFGTNDSSCPIAWGDDIEKAFQEAGKSFEFIRYTGEGHEFSREFQNFMRGSALFFGEHLR